MSKAVKLGELSKIIIENMREENRSLIEKREENIYEHMGIEKIEKKEEIKKYAFIAVAMGEGIKNIFHDMGASAVIEGGQTMNPSTQDMLSSINNINAENIFILPNNKNIIMSANQAAEISDKNVIVLPTKSIPQGITAITAFNQETDLDENISSMSEAIKEVVTGSITYAVRDTEVDGKSIKEGNILGIVEGKISEVGNDAYDTCNLVISKMVQKENELITLFYGKDCDETKVKKLVDSLEEKYPDFDIQCYNGMQPLYYFIVSAE